MNWIEELDNNLADFKALCENLSKEELNKREMPNTWSIAQIIQHLILINQSYIPVFQSVKDNTYKSSWVAKIGFIPKLYGKLLLKSVMPDRSKKMKTFPIWRPHYGELKGDILKDFTANHKALKMAMGAIMPKVGKGVIIGSPANKNIVYSLEKAFDIIVTHEKRHLEQAKELLANIG